jgi:hypothetical protein
MAKVQNIADRALKLIMVQGESAPLEPEDYDDFIALLNDYMASLLADGLDLGYTAVTSIDDEVTIPAGAVLGVVYNMAVLSIPSYGGVSTPELITGAEKGLRTIRKICVQIAATSYPSTLPTGNGNYNGILSPFYPGASE